MPLVTTNDVLLTVDGDMATDTACCCGNPCDPDVPLEVTISWTGTPPELTGGTYTFLGEDFSNGDTKKICPTLYRCSKGTTLAGSTAFGSPTCTLVRSYNVQSYVNLWRYGTSLILSADYSANYQKSFSGTRTTGGACTPTAIITTIQNFSRYARSVRVHALAGKSLSVTRLQTTFGSILSTTVSSGISTENLTNASNFSFVKPMAINSQQEGQLTTTSGVTISWSRASLSDWCGE